MTEPEPDNFDQKKFYGGGINNNIYSTLDFKDDKYNIVIEQEEQSVVNYDQQIVKNTIESNKCSICIHLVRLPGIVCANCSNIVCQSCIENQSFKGYSKKDKTFACLVCKEKVDKANQIKHFHKSTIESIQFKCMKDGCEESKQQFYYLDYLEHISKKCQEIEKSCPVENCFISLGKTKMIEHLNFYECPECKETSVSCLVNQQGNKFLINHICYYKNKIQEQNIQIVEKNDQLECQRGEMTKFVEQIEKYEQVLKEIENQPPKKRRSRQSIICSDQEITIPSIPQNQQKRPETSKQESIPGKVENINKEMVEKIFERVNKNGIKNSLQQKLMMESEKVAAEPDGDFVVCNRINSSTSYDIKDRSKHIKKMISQKKVQNVKSQKKQKEQTKLKELLSRFDDKDKNICLICFKSGPKFDDEKTKCSKCKKFKAHLNCVDFSKYQNCDWVCKKCQIKAKYKTVLDEIKREEEEEEIEE